MSQARAAISPRQHIPVSKTQSELTGDQEVQGVFGDLGDQGAYGNHGIYGDLGDQGACGHQVSVFQTV